MDSETTRDGGRPIAFPARAWVLVFAAGWIASFWVVNVSGCTQSLDGVGPQSEAGQAAASSLKTRRADTSCSTMIRPAISNPSLDHAPFALVKADRTIDFRYNDSVLLGKGELNGGRVWIPTEVLARPGSVPLVVLLHGIAYGGAGWLHRLLPGSQNLIGVTKRLIAEGAVRPLILAAPSQTVQCGWSGSLWTAGGFDLAHFVMTVERVMADHGLEAKVDRTHISVLGHSGAGCGSGRNGLYRIARQIRKLKIEKIEIRLLGLMDTCFSGETGGRVLERHLGPDTRVFAMWVEPERWNRFPRGIKEFAKVLGPWREVSCDLQRYVRCRENRRNDRLYKANEQSLLNSFALHPHDALPIWFMEEALRLFLKKQETGDDQK